MQVTDGRWEWIPERRDLAHAIAALMLPPADHRQIQEAIDGGATEWDASTGAWASWRAGDSGTMDEGPAATTSAEEAWALLAGANVIPAEWLRSAHRRFAWRTRCRHCVTAASEPGAPQRCARCGRTERVITELGSHPYSVNDCVAFAGDVRGVLAAEQLAHAEAPVWRMVDRSYLLANVARSEAPEIQAMHELGYAFDPLAVAGNAVVLAAPGLLLR